MFSRMYNIHLLSLGAIENLLQKKCTVQNDITCVHRGMLLQQRCKRKKEHDDDACVQDAKERRQCLRPTLDERS